MSNTIAESRKRWHKKNSALFLLVVSGIYFSGSLTADDIPFIRTLSHRCHFFQETTAGKEASLSQAALVHVAAVPQQGNKKKKGTR